MHRRNLARTVVVVILALLVVSPAYNALGDTLSGIFSWNVTKNDFGAYDCGAGKTIIGAGVLKFGGYVENPSPYGYYIRSAAFHSDQAGCSKTTESAQAGLSFSGKTQFSPGENGNFLASFDTAADSRQCGRVQLDALFVNNTTGERIGIFGIVFNYGVDCGATPTPTPTPSPTPSPSPTPTPTPISQLLCMPSSQSIQSGQFANFSASGGLDIYFWNAPSGNPQFGFSRNFSTQLFTSQFEEIKTVTVESGNQVANCIVHVFGSNPVSNPALNISKTVRNVSTNSSEVETVSANIGDTVEFVIRVSDFSDSNANNVRVSDTLPGGLRYVSGSTTLDDNFQSDGIINGGIFIGTLASNQNRILRFHAIVENIGTTFLTNTSTASGDNVPTVSDTANVSIFISGVQGQLSIQKLGRNLSRGQTSERTVVSVSPGDTVEFVIRVQNNSGTVLNNVIVNDILPGALSYIDNTTTINGVPTANGITTSGINIGSLSPGQESIIRFSVNVGTFDTGITIENTATAQVDNTPLVSSRISLTRGQVAGAVKVKTGTTNSLILAFLLSGLVTYGYMLYTRTEVFRRRNLVASIQRIQRNSQRLNFARFL